MMPGMGRGFRPQQMRRMMKQAGLSIDEIEGVEEVIIRTSTKEYIFKDAAVSIMTVQGQETYQVTGEPEIVERAAREAGKGKEVLADDVDVEVSEGYDIPEADVSLVAEQANVSKEEARKALDECDGNPAEAILKLLES